MLRLHRVEQRRSGRVAGEGLSHRRPQHLVLGGVVNVQVGLEHLPPGRGAQDVLRVVVGACRDAGDVVQVATQRVMEHVHHGHVVLESHRFRLLGWRCRSVWLPLAELAGLVVAGSFWNRSSRASIVLSFEILSGRTVRLRKGPLRPC
jgi:hypothetical protein